MINRLCDVLPLYHISSHNIAALLYLICTIPRLSWCWVPSSAVALCALSARSTTWADASDQARVFEHFNRECLNIFNFSFLLVLILHFLQYKRKKTSNYLGRCLRPNESVWTFSTVSIETFSHQTFLFFYFLQDKRMKTSFTSGDAWDQRGGCMYNL